LYMRDNQPEHSLSQRVAMEVFWNRNSGISRKTVKDKALGNWGFIYPIHLSTKGIISSKIEYCNI
jgi:hypothetical protein